jgi:leucyl-tRNA synthetase
VVKHPEPFTKLVHQGMILGMVYRFYAELLPGEKAGGKISRAFSGTDPNVAPDPERGGFRDKSSGSALEVRYLVEKDIVFREGKPFHPEYGVELLPVAEKMSKSRGNVVNPDTVIAEFGADSLRLYEMFMGPLEHVKPWQTAGLLGVRRFLDKVDTLVTRAQENPKTASEPLDDETEKLLHRTVKKVTADIEALSFNTCVSTMMIFANHLSSLEVLPLPALSALLLCLSPFAPHLAEDGAARLGLQLDKPIEGGRAPCLSDSAWPSYDEAFCVDNIITVPVQVNGKVRGRVTLPRDSSEADVREAALQDPGVTSAISGKPVKKMVYVPGRILNFIV